MKGEVTIGCKGLLKTMMPRFIDKVSKMKPQTMKAIIMVHNPSVFLITNFCHKTCIAEIPKTMAGPIQIGFV